MLSVSRSLTSQDALNLITDPGLHSHRIHLGEGMGRGLEDQSSGKALKHSALFLPPSGMCLPEDGRVGERVGDGSPVTFAEEDEAASTA